jgi:hypothetical protein
MKKRDFVFVLPFFFLGCLSQPEATSSDGLDSDDATSSCTLTENTSEASDVNGCALLTRDVSDCEQDRIDAGLSGVFLNFSCRVSLSIVSSGGADFVQAQSDGLPDYKSHYFDSEDACYDADMAGEVTNPNTIEEQTYALFFPLEPNESSGEMDLGVVGLSVNGVPIFNNEAAPGDDIYDEAQTFDLCQAHPTNLGEYHYHSEPYAITYDDAGFVGVMRDGYAVYGRKDADGTYPDLDEAGGHTDVTADSPSTEVYHYHVNEQMATSGDHAGETQWFITTGTYHGTPGDA